MPIYVLMHETEYEPSVPLIAFHAASVGNAKNVAEEFWTDAIWRDDDLVLYCQPQPVQSRTDVLERVAASRRWEDGWSWDSKLDEPTPAMPAESGDGGFFSGTELPDEAEETYVRNPDGTASRGSH